MKISAGWKVVIAVIIITISLTAIFVGGELLVNSLKGF